MIGDSCTLPMPPTDSSRRTVYMGHSRPMQPILPAGLCSLRSESDLHRVAAKRREGQEETSIAPVVVERKRAYLLKME
jgi:hypothetical protein